MKCGDMMWNDGVMHGEYGSVSLCKTDVVVEYSDVEWVGTILDMV